MTSEPAVKVELQVEWITLDANTQQGVVTVGFLGDQMIGVNDLVIGDLVSLLDPDGVLERSYERTRTSRRANEADLAERYLGQVQPRFSRIGPWRIVGVTSDCSFNVTLRTDQTIGDLLVRSDQAHPTREASVCSSS